MILGLRHVYGWPHRRNSAAFEFLRLDFDRLLGLRRFVLDDLERGGVDLSEQFHILGLHDTQQLRLLWFGSGNDGKNHTLGSEIIEQFSPRAVVDLFKI